MTQPGYNPANEPMWWWKVALHLDEAQAALANVMAHNADDPRLAHALYGRLREGQAILLEIFRMKGLLPGSPNGKIDVPMPEMPVPAVPAVPMPGVPVPTSIGGEAATAVPTTDVEQRPPLAAEEPAVSEADQVAVVAPEQPAAEDSPEPAVPAIALEVPTVAPPADPGAGGAGG